MRQPLLLVTLTLAGCASTPAPTPATVAPPTPAEIPIPAEMVPHVRQAEALGLALYQNDHVSAVGTDVLIENIGSPQGKGLGGYLTVQEATEEGQPGRSWAVQFFSAESPPRFLYKIRVSPGTKVKPTFEKLDPPRPVASALPLIRARQTAIAELMRVEPPRQPINPVILPGAAIGQQGILVYLLAGTKRPGVAVIGKHHRVLVSDDGARVLDFQPMTKSILELEFGRMDPGQKPAALMVSHIVTEWPLETHVFVSLLHRQPVFVATSRFFWRVDGRHISIFEKAPPRSTQP